MTMELSSHQISLEPFRTYAYYSRYQQEMELSNSSSSSSGSSWVRHPQQPIAPASTSLLFYHVPTATAEMPKRTDRDTGKPWLPPSPKPHDPHQGGAVGEETPNAKAGAEGERQAVVVAAAQPEQVLPLHQRATATTTKRARATDDVDGPGTASLSCKKRRLLLRLVTSRLSRPFSFPATHILIRESTGGNNAVSALHHRLRQQLASLGARRGGVGHHQGSALVVRKAAILNRVRIRVHQAAVSRGTAFPAAASDGHARGGVAAPVFGGSGSGVGMIPPVRRPHTTSFHLPITHGYNSRPHHQQIYHHHQQYQQQQQQQQQCNYNQGVDVVSHPEVRHVSTSHQRIGGHTNNPNIAATYIYASPQSHKEAPLGLGYAAPAASVRHAPLAPAHNSTSLPSTKASVYDLHLLLPPISFFDFSLPD